MTTDHTTPDRVDDRVSVNDHLDYGRGFVRNGVADTSEARFGVFPRFGKAGGCVNMLITVETGHLVNVTDMHSADLTSVEHRTAAHGFTVAAFTAAGLEIGEPTVALHEPVDTTALPDLIELALRALADQTNQPHPRAGGIAPDHSG